MGPCRSTWIAAAVVLGAAIASCNDRCPTPIAFHCCQGGCIGDVPAEPVCTASGWACPEGSVSFDTCPGPRICMGALPGPLPDAGP